MAFYDKFPYTNFQEINLDRIIKELMDVKDGLQFVIDNASLKYADPIQWNITHQYQANTVVIDPATGIAYISTKPVPDNVQITDTGYWTPIFDLSDLFSDLEQEITDEQTARQAADHALSDDITAETTARTNAVNTLTANITAEEMARIAADNALSTRIDNIIVQTEYPNFDIRKYGGTGDGVTNDTNAFNACMAENGIVYLPQFPGALYVLDTIELGNDTTVIGTKSQIKQNQNVLFRITGNNVTIKGIEVSSRDTCISIKALSQIADILIDDVYISNCQTMLSDIESTANYSRLYVNRLSGTRVSGIGVDLENAWAFLFLNDVTVDKVGITATDPCFKFENNAGMQLTRCEAEGGATDGTHAGAAGFLFKNCTAVWLERCMADTVDGPGFYLDSGTCQYFYFNMCVASLMFNHGFFLSGNHIQMDNCICNGRANLPTSQPGANGLYSFASYCNISNLTLENMTGYDLALAQGVYNVFTGILLNGGANSATIGASVSGYLTGGVMSHPNITSSATAFKYAFLNSSGVMVRNDLS